MTTADEIRRVADQLRVLSGAGIRWSADDIYHRDRYERLRHIAAELFAVADTRGADEIERSVFRELTHAAPVPVTDGAVLDDDGRMLLIQRADNGLWAMPGGGIDMGEVPSEAVVREVREETGFVVEPTELVGLWDSTRCGSVHAVQLFVTVFLCRVIGTEEPTHSIEALDTGWFAPDGLPPLSPGHHLRVPFTFRFLDERMPHFDR